MQAADLLALEESYRLQLQKCSLYSSDPFLYQIQSSLPSICTQLFGPAQSVDQAQHSSKSVVSTLTSNSDKGILFSNINTHYIGVLLNPQRSGFMQYLLKSQSEPQVYLEITLDSLPAALQQAVSYSRDLPYFLDGRLLNPSHDKHGVRIRFTLVEYFLFQFVLAFSRQKSSSV